MKTRTSNYQFTVQLRNGEPINEGEMLLNVLRAIIKEHNKSSKKKKYVKLQGRGHRYGVRRWNQSLPLNMASSADVYVYIRN